MNIVTQHTRRARIYQSLDARLATCVNDILRAPNVHLAEQLVGRLGGALGRRRGGVDNNIRAHTVKYIDDFRRVRDVGLEVLYAVRRGPAVALAFQVDDGDGGRVPVAKEDADDVVAKKAAAAGDEDVA